MRMSVTTRRPDPGPPVGWVRRSGSPRAVGLDHRDAGLSLVVVEHRARGKRPGFDDPDGWEVQVRLAAREARRTIPLCREPTREAAIDRLSTWVRRIGRTIEADDGRPTLSALLDARDTTDAVPDAQLDPWRPE